MGREELHVELRTRTPQTNVLLRGNSQSSSIRCDKQCSLRKRTLKALRGRLRARTEFQAAPRQLIVVDYKQVCYQIVIRLQTQIVTIMSSFKRKAGARAELPVGTRPSPSSPSTLLTSTGIPSLDDILGGGLPISCSLLILAPDPHSAYGQLVQNYSIAQGLVAGQTVCVVDESPDSIFDDCMWIPPNGPIAEDKQEQDAAQQDEKIKIAWRYETMKQFQTTVDAISNQYVVSLSFRDPGIMLECEHFRDEFCRTFDLTCRIPRPVVDKALESKQIVAIDLASVVDGPMIFQSVIGRITEVCQESCSASKPLRICIPSLGSPSWGEFGPQVFARLISW